MYKKNKSGISKHIDFILLDIIALEISFVLSYIYRNGWGFENAEFKHMYIKVALFLAGMCVLISVLFGCHKNIMKRGYYIEFVETVKMATIISAFLIAYLYLEKLAYYYSRTVFIITWALYIVLSYIIRCIWKKVVKKYNLVFVKNTSTMFVVTTSLTAAEVVENFKSSLKKDYKISGIIIVDKDMTGEMICEIPVVASVKDAVGYICRNWVDEVFIYMPSEYKEIEQQIADSCALMGITVHQHIAQVVSQVGKVQMVERFGEYTVLSSTIKTVSTTEMAIKRMLDIIGGIVGLFITGLLFIFVAPAIYIKSPGPIFFKQWRVGQNGKRFQIYKFRSMYMDAEERKAELMAQNKVKDGMMFKIDNDPRIIGGEKGKGIGNFIRNTSIDEFPQFINVLKGDMSLVGTRPPTLDEWEKYELHHRARLATKPGLTGMWQVSGRSNITDFETIVKLDTEYIMNWSISKDIKILFKTVLVVLKREGSA